MDFIRGTTLVHIKIRCWSGEKKASRTNDIRLGFDGEIPPEKLLQLGRKKIFPPKALDPLVRQRKAVDRVCLNIGTRFMGGYSIPDNDVPGLIEKLENIQKQFYLSLDEFLSSYDENKRSWIEENEEFEHLIEGQVPDRDNVKGSFEFSYKLYKLNPLEGFEPDENDVANQVLREVGMECKRLSKSLFDRKTAISGKKLIALLQPLTRKLDVLSFGNSRILKVFKEFVDFGNSIPLERIDKDHRTFGHSVTFLSMISDDALLERVIDGSFSVTQLITPKPTASLVTADMATSSTTKPVVSSSFTSGVGAYF